MQKNGYLWVLGLFFTVWGGGFFFGGVMILTTKELTGLVPLVIGSGGLTAAIIFLTKAIKQRIETRKIEKHGKNVIAKYISADSSITVNGLIYYTINFMWDNDEGKQITSKSAKNFTADEVALFRDAQYFEVRTYQNKARIMDFPDPDKVKALKKAKSELNATKKCPSCGANCKGETKCPYCDYVYRS